MVLICGVDVAVNELPLSSSIDYRIIDTAQVAIALKTQARQPACVTVYLLSSLKGYLKGLPVSVSDKTVLFDDKEDLISLINMANSVPSVASDNATPPKKEEKYESVTKVLGGSGAKAEQPATNVEVKAEPVIKAEVAEPINEPKVEVAQKVEPVMVQNEVASENDDMGVSEITDVDVSLPEIFNCEPYDDNDSLKVKLKGKEEQLSQAYAMLDEARKTIDQAYEEQTKAVNEVKSVYDGKLVEAQNVIDTLKNKISDLQQSSGKYAIYGNHPNALLKEGFSKGEKAIISSLNMDLQVLFNGTDIYRMYDTVKKTIQYSKEGYIFVDLVGDYILSRSYKSSNASVSSLSLLDKLSESDIKKVAESAVSVGTSKVITCNPYHDIKLLDVDWGTALTNISRAFPNRKIVLLFGSIKSFAVEYTVSKFSTMFRTTVFVKCSPFGINFVYGKMKFIPNGRGIKWMVSDYYEGSETLLNKIATEYSVKSGDLMSLDDIK